MELFIENAVGLSSNEAHSLKQTITRAHSHPAWSTTFQEGECPPLSTSSA